jgi:amino acid transporter
MEEAEIHSDKPDGASLRNDRQQQIAADVAQLNRLGYQQELARRMSGFSNYAISLSIICILAGCVTSFSVGFCSVGGAAIGLGWPLACLFSLVVAATMGQIASAYPTAGGLYHWAAILGGRGWGWMTAWFNLAGLIAVLAAVNVGFVRFVAGFLDHELTDTEQLLAVTGVTVSHAVLNHRGIRLTTLLTDFSGYWILLVSVILSILLFANISDWDVARLVTFHNYSGPGGNDVFPASESLIYLFALGLLLPAYTVTGFDASAHVAEETVGAAENVPRAIVRSVIVSGVFGWIMLIAVVLAMPDLDAAAAQGERAFGWTLKAVLPESWATLLFGGISVAQYLCGLAIVTSASRMMFAFARDGGLPYSARLRHVCPTFQTPIWAIWVTTAAAIGLTAFARLYSAIAAACAVLLYISYAVPIGLGYLAYGQRWTRMGPWHLGRWYRPLAGLAVLGCGLLLWIGVKPPNDKALVIVGGMALVMALVWFAWSSKRFAGPPEQMLSELRCAAGNDPGEASHHQTVEELEPS